MAAKKKGTLEGAQTTFMRAMRDFENVVIGLVSSPAPKTKTKAKKKVKKTKARRR